MRHHRTGHGRLVRTLDRLNRAVDGGWPDGAVRKRDLLPGDRVLVSTRNSVYSLHSLGGDRFAVSGGWFDHHGQAGPVTVNGCTFGGTALWADVVAAPGLFLEFGNSVCTTRIRRVRLLRHDLALVGPVGVES